MVAMRYLNQRQLEAAVMVRRMGTVTRAGDRMALTQPAISRLIAQLEEELGFSLFERQAGRLVASARGIRFLDRAERFLNDNKDLAAFGEDLKMGRGESISILAVPSLAQTLLPTAFQCLSQTHAMRATIITAQRREIPRLLRQHRFDIGLVSLPVDSENMRIERFASLGAVCILPDDHPLAALKAVPANELLSYPFIAPGASTLLVQRLQDALAREGRSINADVTIETTAVIHQFVANKLGISIGHAFARLDSPLGVTTRPIIPDLVLDYAFLFPDDRELKPGAIALARQVQAIAENFANAPIDALASR